MTLEELVNNKLDKLNPTDLIVCVIFMHIKKNVVTFLFMT